MKQAEAQTTRTLALFVSWQDQDTKRHFPVGRLVRHPNGNKPRYEFCYIKGHKKAREMGFTSLQAFPELDEVYRSNDLFPLFGNRLMPRSRPDFSEYLARINLDETADDFEILARSGGRRTTDSLELFPMPVREDENGCYVTYFLVHGIRHLPDCTHRRIEKLRQNDRLFVMNDSQNPVDHNALILRTEDYILTGYLPRYILSDAWKLQRICEYINVFVQQVNPPSTPIQQRLLCRMESCSPEGFKPFSSEDFDPVVDSATNLEY